MIQSLLKNTPLNVTVLCRKTGTYSIAKEEAFEIGVGGWVVITRGFDEPLAGEAQIS